MINKTMTIVALVAIAAVAAIGIGFAYSASTSNDNNSTDSDWVTVGLYNNATPTADKWLSDNILDIAGLTNQSKIYYNSVKTAYDFTEWTIVDVGGTAYTGESQQQLVDGDVYIYLTDDYNNATSRTYAMTLGGLSNFLNLPDGIILTAKIQKGEAAPIIGALNKSDGSITFSGLKANTAYKLSIEIWGSVISKAVPQDLAAATLTFKAVPTDVPSDEKRSSVVTISGSGTATASASTAGTITSGTTKVEVGETVTITAGANERIVVKSSGGVCLVDKVVKNLDESTTFPMPQDAVTITATTASNCAITLQDQSSKLDSTNPIVGSATGDVTTTAIQGETLTIKAGNDGATIKIVSGDDVVLYKTLAASATITYTPSSAAITITVS